jgi:hypothetical protein
MYLDNLSQTYVPKLNASTFDPSLVPFKKKRSGFIQIPKKKFKKKADCDSQFLHTQKQ